MLRGEETSSYILSNVGTLFFNHSKVSDIDQPVPNLKIALQQTQLAVLLDNQNYFAWRKLGFILVALGKEKDAFWAWSYAPDIELELLQWNQQAVVLGDFESALVWCQRAATIAPQLRDPWYCIGSLYQRQQKWQEALAAFSEAVNRTELHQVSLSDIYYEQGIIYRSATEYQDLDKALEMYDTALSVDSFSNPIIKADTFYRKGEILVWQGLDPITEFEQALELNPDHNWARLRLGSTQYWYYRDLVSAETNLKIVIDSWLKSSSPHLKWAYVYLGDIYSDSGMKDEALFSYEKALQLDSDDETVLRKVAKLREE